MATVPHTDGRPWSDDDETAVATPAPRRQYTLLLGRYGGEHTIGTLPVATGLFWIGKDEDM